MTVFTVGDGLSILLSSFGKVLGIVFTLLSIGFILTFLSGFPPLIPFIGIAWVVLGILIASIIGLYLVIYIPGAFVAALMTMFDSELLDKVESEDIATVISRILVHASLSWYYVETKLMGKAYVSRLMF